MSLLARLKDAVQCLDHAEIPYALAGGLVASLYRVHPRATADIDFAVFSEDADLAHALLRQLDLEPHPLRQANLEGGPLFAIKRKSTSTWIVCGRKSGAPDAIGVDLILSHVPWVKDAVDRAQANRVDFGFGGIPCLTREDLVLSKLYSVGNQATRFMDLDDLRSIFESREPIDWDYVRDRMKHFHIDLPKELVPFVPKR